MCKMCRSVDGAYGASTHVKPGDAVTFFATLPDHQPAVLWIRQKSVGVEAMSSD